MQDVFYTWFVRCLSQMGHCRHGKWVSCIISYFDIARSIRLSSVSEPFLLRCHTIRGTGVDEPYAFRTGGTSRGRSQHRICSISHHEHSEMVIIVGVGGVIGDFSACGSRLMLLLSGFFFVVADFTTIPAFDSVVLSAWTGMEAPSSSKCSSVVFAFLPKLGVIFISQT